jgi:hypothetical protein
VVRLFSWLFAAALILLSLGRPAVADQPFQPSTFPWGVEVSIPYPIDDPQDPTATEDIVLASPLSSIKFVSNGPVLPPQHFEVKWICPEGSSIASSVATSLSNGACYERNGLTPRLVRPVAAQVSFAYDYDGKSDTTEQIIIMAQVPEKESKVPIEASAEDDSEVNPLPARLYLKSFCPQPPSLVPFVYPPNVCAR